MGFQRANPSIASTHSSSNTASGSLIILICLASAFMLLAILGTTFYYYHRKRSNSFNFNRSNHKVLLLKRELPLEKSFLINSFNGNSSTIGATGKTRAVRSPSSGQVNPFNKKTPSPVGCLKDTFPNANVSGIVNEGSTISQKNELTKTMNKEPEGGDVVRKINLPLEKASVLNSIENLNEKSVNRKDSGSSLISSVAPFKTKTLESEEPVSNDSKKLGQLHFKLKYSYDKKVLCLGVIRCTNLPAPKKDSNATIDPYVKLQLLPEKQHKAKTRVIRRSTNPVYNEEFTFYGITPNFLDNLVVHFVVLNFDRFARDEILGEVICKLNQLEFDSLEKQINLVRDISPRGNKLKIQELGEVLISLCYQPIANRLTVVILKARNLPKMDLTGLCDPYVKIYVYHNGQRIFKKRTHVKKRTLNPVFNESFVFDIPPDEGLDNIQIQFTVFDHDRVTRNELIGKIDIGCKSGNPITEKHWNEVIKAPRRQIAEWHKLKEFVLSHFNFFVYSSFDRNVCEDIHTVRETILWIGLMKNRFVLLTSQNNVYDIAYNSLDWRKGRLYLSGARTRQNIYPELTKKIDDGTGFFSGTHKRLVVIDEYSQYLYVESNDMNVANTYDIVHSKTMYYKVKDNVQPDSKEHHVALSSNEALAFYLLEFKNDDDKSGLIQKVSFYGGHRLTDSSNLKPTSNKYYLCYSQTAADKIYMSTDSCKHRLSWNVIQGFVDTYNFYLFSSNQTVLIFSTSAFSTPGTQVKLNLIRYDDFFVCNSAPTLTTSGKYALLVIGIIIVCAVLGTVIFFLIFSGFQNNDQPQQQQDNLDNSNIMQQSQQPQMIQPKTSNAGIMVVIPSGGGDPNVQLQQQIALQQMALQSNMQPIQSSVTPWKRSKTKRNSQCSRTGSNKRNSAKSSRGSKITSKQSRKQSSRKRSSKRKQSKRASKKQDD